MTLSKVLAMEYAEVIHEGKWLQGLIKRFVDSPDIFDNLTIDDAVEWRISFIFKTKRGDVDTRNIASLLHCVFSSNTVEEIVWFGIGYLSEIVNYLRKEVLREFIETKQDAKLREIIWRLTRKLVKIDLLLMIGQLIRTASEVSSDTDMIKKMCQWGDVIITRGSKQKVPQTF